MDFTLILSTSASSRSSHNQLFMKQRRSLLTVEKLSRSQEEAMHTLLWVLSQSTLFLVLRKIKRILEIDLKLEKNPLAFSWSHVSMCHIYTQRRSTLDWVSGCAMPSNEQGKGEQVGEIGWLGGNKMSKKGHQKGLLKTETIPSKPKDTFLLHHPHSSQVQRTYQGRKDPGFVGQRIKGSPGFFFFFTGLKSG